jgi:hypothetical protein
MANIDPLDPRTPPSGPNAPPGGGPAPNPSPVPPQPKPSKNPAGAQAVPTKKGGTFTILGSLLGGIAEDWQKDRELKRELKRARELAQQAAEQDLTRSPTDQPASEGSQDLLEQERNKRIRMISDFTDVKESADHKVKRWISGAACAIIPWALVIFVTSDVGEYFAGKTFTWSDWGIVGIFGITLLLEVGIAVVTNAWGNTVHDMNAAEAESDKTKWRDRMKTQMIAWGVLSLVSGFALFMFLMQKAADNAAVAQGALTTTALAGGLHANVDYGLNANLINIILRVVGTLAIDPACVFAVHQTSKNLDQFLKQQAQVTLGITQISDSFDKQQEAAARAEMRQKENERFLELKGKMDDVNATMFGKMGEKMLEMSDQMFEQMKLPHGRIVDADENDGRNVRRLRPRD